MVLAIATRKKIRQPPDFTAPDDDHNTPRRAWIGGGLTLRILAVNLIAPIILVVGLLYLGQYRDSLIAAELKTLSLQSQLFAGAMAEGAVRPVKTGKPLLFAKPQEIEMLIPELSRRMLRRLGETMDTRTRLFSDTGVMIGDSEQLAVRIKPVSPDPPQSMTGARALGERILELLPMQNTLPLYPVTMSDQIGDYPDAAAALADKRAHASAWEYNKHGHIILTAAAPVQKIRQVIGVVMLSRDGKEIQAAVDQMRFDVLTVFLGSLSVTIFLSMYLAGVIGRPLRKLARAAESVRMGHGRQIDIPDLTHRNDEIGELSAALRDMTKALWDRMDTIERFAADVSHEIKNPLTSLRSAVETAAIVKDRPEDLHRLLGIMQHDVTRLTRLISDISNASRLDAELSREELGIVSLEKLLTQLMDAHHVTLQHRGSAQKLDLDSPKTEIPVLVRASEHRLAQIFENLIVNALSFSPPDGIVHIRIIPDRDRVTVTVSDQGPGIPDSKLENIFERFYTERPKHEDYGSHSGLGLSIARQIVRAHNGSIFAENIRDFSGRVTGARFTVILNRA